MNLPPPLDRYSPDIERQRNSILARADSLNVKKNTDMDVASGSKLVLRSPDGTRWNITVDNAGVITAAAL